MKLGTLVLWLLLVLGAGWLWFFAPYYVDWIKMGEAAGDAALTWQAFGKKRGEDELVIRMKERGLPDYLHPGLCSFDEIPGDGSKQVYCSWDVDVYLPQPFPPRRLSFECLKVVGADGKLQ